MAAGALRTSVCGHGYPVNVKDGTLCLADSPTPSAIGQTVAHAWSSLTHALDPEYGWLKSRARVAYSHLPRGLRGDVVGALCIFRACRGAEDYAGEAMVEETDCQLMELVSNLIPGLLLTVVVVGTTTVLGAGIGALVANVAGAVVGADLGFDVGMAALTWLGIGFLAKSIFQGFGEMTGAVRNGIELAWQARNLTGLARGRQVDRASHELARSVGILMRLVLKGILAYLLKKAAMSSARSAVRTIQGVRSQGAGAISEAVVAELVGRLRTTRFGDGLANWVKENWQKLKDNPKLRVTEAEVEAAGSGSSGQPGTGGGNASGKGNDSPSGEGDDNPPSKESKSGGSSQAAADADKIANGHAYGKHAKEFGNISRDQFKGLVQDTIENPSDSRPLSNGRTAYWSDSQQMVVIKNPNAADGGTAFMPTGGKAYFNNLK